MDERLVVRFCMMEAQREPVSGFAMTCLVFRAIPRKGEHSLPINFGSDAQAGFPSLPTLR